MGILLTRTRLALLGLVLLLAGCAPAAAPTSASATRTPSAQPSGVAGATLRGPTGTMGSQLPLWASKGIKVPAGPSKPRATSSILGTDVSEWQGATNLAAYPRQFILIREQYGTAGLDKQFISNRDQARARNLPRGFYHYAYPEFNSADAEARTFALGTDWRPGELAVLDFEEAYSDPVGWSLRFVQVFESLEHFKPLVYLNVYTLYASNWGAVAANGNGAWVAQWNFNLTPPPSGGFAFAAAKQYTDADSVAGIGGRVDGDVFYGDAGQFQAYGAPGNVPAPGPAPAPSPPSPPAPAPAPTPAPISGGCVHVVQPGETLSGLVGGRWPQVAAANGIRNANLIFVGQRINLCAGGGGAPASGCVIVRAGDTLSGLFGSAWPAVARRNGVRNPNLIFPGQRLC